MMVNPCVDGYTKTPNQLKMLPSVTRLQQAL